MRVHSTRMMATGEVAPVHAFPLAFTHMRYFGVRELKLHLTSRKTEVAKERHGHLSL